MRSVATMLRCALTAMCIVGCSRAPLPSPRMPLVGTPLLEVFTEPPPLDVEPAPTVPAVVQLQLTNRLQVRIVELPQSTTVTAAIVCRTAGEDDVAVPAGIANLAATLVARGPARAPERALRAEIDAQGIGLSGYATRDAGFVVARGPATAARATLAALADSVQRPALTPAAFQDVMHAVELDRDVGTYSSDYATEFAELSLYGVGNAYARHLRGTPDSLSRASLEYVRYYRQVRYTPLACALVVAGPITRERVESDITRGWGTWLATAPPVRADDLPRSHRARPRVTVFPMYASGLVRIVHAQVGPTPHAPDALAFEVLAEVFAGLESSRLDLSLRETEGATSMVERNISRARNAETFVLSMWVPRGALLATFREILREVHDMGVAVSAEEVGRAVRVLRQRALARSWGDLSAATEVGTRWALGGDGDSLALPAYDDVTPADVAHVASHYLDVADGEFVVMGPNGVAHDLESLHTFEVVQLYWRR